MSRATNLGTGSIREQVDMLDNVDKRHFDAAPWDTVNMLSGSLDAPSVLPSGSTIWSRALQTPRVATATR